MEEKQIRLSVPVEVSGKKLEIVVVRPCTFGDVRLSGVKKTEDLEDISTFSKLVGNLTGLTQIELDKINMTDYLKIAGAVNSFLGLTSQAV